MGLSEKATKKAKIISFFLFNVPYKTQLVQFNVLYKTHNSLQNEDFRIYIIYETKY